MSDNVLIPDEVVEKPTVMEETDEKLTVKSEVKANGNGANEPVDDLKPRLERLGGEPAPDITPEEFARLQQSGQIHIDPRGRVRSSRPEETDAGVTLRKRRAWYALR